MRPNEITCPRCGAGAGAPCTNPATGKPYRHNAPHLDRIRAAKEAGE